MMINVARQFSTTPAGRFRSDGEFSGERFRDDLLVPALNSGEVVEVELAGTRGYGSSFLEEAFGGLIRLGRFEHADLQKRLKILASDPAYEVYRKRALTYIEQAQKAN